VKLTGDAYRFETSGDGSLRLIAEGGASWDALVDAAAARGLWGIENLAGIPGSAGGALVQNIGAYGSELSSVFRYAEVLDTATGAKKRVGPEEAMFGYRTSVFKRRPELVIMRIALALGEEANPILAYPDLAHAQEAHIPLGTPREIAEAVRVIRSRKFPSGGEDGRSAGSFFKNPAVAPAVAARLAERYPGLPAYSLEDGTVKLSLAWLLDHVLGLAGLARGPVRLFERQPLVIVASLGARAEDVEALAHEVEKRVLGALGLVIEREVESFR